MHYVDKSCLGPSIDKKSHSLFFFKKTTATSTSRIVGVFGGNVDPGNILKQLLYPQMWYKGTIVSYFFKNKNENRLTINGISYREMDRKFFVAEN